MDEPFKTLIGTSSLWLPAVTWLVGQASASGAGRRIGSAFKSRLKWLKDPEAEKAFHSAFRKGIERYEREHGRTEEAKAVASVLSHIAEQDTSRRDREGILYQIFAAQPDPAALSGIVKQYTFALEGMTVSEEDVTTALETLILEYLRPAFRAESYFAERVGFAEMVGLLQQIRQILAEPLPDLEGLEKDYCAKIAEKYEFITMQGISPKVQNRTIGIRMKDVFVPLEATSNFIQSYMLEREQPEPKRSLELIRHLQLSYSRLLQEEPGQSDFSQRLDMLVKSSMGSEVRAELESLFELSESALSERTNKYETGDHFRTLISSMSSIFSRLGDEVVPDLESLLGEMVVNASMKDVLHLPKVVVQGDPGSGKSTLTRYVAWAIVNQQTELIPEEALLRLPIRIRAIEFGEAIEQGRVDSLVEYLLEQANRFAPLISQRLVTGNALILFDGLDEVGKPSLRVRVKEYVDDFVADPAFTDNRLLITTRIVGYERDGLTGRFPHFTLAELNDEQIEGFVQSWYRAIYLEMPEAIDVASESSQLLKAITNSKSIHRMARNPLLLTIIALIKWQVRALPDQRVLLYDAAMQTLLRTWPLTQRRVELDELFIREWLAPLALYIFTQGARDLIDEYTLMERLVDSMMRLKASTELEAKRKSRDLLESVSQHSGVLLPRGTDEDGRTLYGFLHQTFAEYLTAYHLVGKWEDGDLVLLEYAHNPRWREVLLLMAGYLGTHRRANAGRFIEEIRNLNSSPYEEHIHRDLLLACRVLGDGVPAGPGRLVESLLGELFSLWLVTPLQLLRRDIEELFGKFKGTEYEAVLARMADKWELNASQTLTLARRIGPEYLSEALVELLEDEDSLIRHQAAQELAKLDDPRGVEALAELLKDEDLLIRFQTAEALAGQGDPRGVQALTELLEEEDSLIRHQSVQALLELGGPRAVEALVELLANEDLPVRHQARSGLTKMDDPRSMESLIGLLDRGEPKIRYEAAQLLAERDDPRGARELARLLEEDDSRVRIQAARVLAGRDDPRGVKELVSLLKNEDPQIRYEAARVLAEQDDPRGVEALAGLLEEDDSRVRYQAARVLAGRDDPRGIEALVGLLGDEDKLVHYWAARVLAGRDDSRGVEALVRLLKDEDPQIRYQVARVLAERGDPRGIEALVGLLGDEDKLIRYQAMRKLAEVGGLRGVQALVQLLEDEVPTMRRLARRLLPGLDDSHVVEALIRLLRRKEPQIRFEAAQGLAERDDPRGVEALVELLEDEDPDIRLQAANVLAEQDDPIAFQAIAARLDILLNDNFKPEEISSSMHPFRSPADVAYGFLERHLTPGGDIELTAQVSSVTR